MNKDQVYVRSELNRWLLSMTGRADLVDQWWESPNKAFDGKTPNSVYWSGEAGRKEVASYIFRCAEGGGS